MKSLIREKLREAESQSQLVSVYVNSYDLSESLVGYVDLITDSHVRLKSVNMFGEDDGWEVFRLDSIFMIRVNGIYERKIEHIKKSIKTSLFEKTSLSGKTSGDLFQSTLLQAKKANVLVRLYNERGEQLSVGFVERVEGSEAYIANVDSYGVFHDGYSVLRLHELHRLHCDSKEDKALRRLYIELK